MTAVVVAAEPSLVIGHRRRIRLLAVLAVVVIAVASTGVWFVRWRSQLHELTSYPTYGLSTSYPIGESLYFGVNVVSDAASSHPDDHGELSIHISSVQPFVIENTANADISVLRCQLSRGGGGPTAQPQAVINQFCSTLTPFGSGTVTVGSGKGDSDIVVRVIPRRAGRVKVSGLEVRYSDGLRHGTQHVGAQIGVSTPR